MPSCCAPVAYNMSHYFFWGLFFYHEKKKALDVDATPTLDFSLNVDVPHSRCKIWYIMLRKHITFLTPLLLRLTLMSVCFQLQCNLERNNLSYFCQTCATPRQSRLSWHGMIQSSAPRSVKKAKTDIMAGAVSKYSTQHKVLAKFSLWCHHYCVLQFTTVFLFLKTDYGGAFE